MPEAAKDHTRQAPRTEVDHRCFDLSPGLFSLLPHQMMKNGRFRLIDAAEDIAAITDFLSAVLGEKQADWSMTQKFGLSLVVSAISQSVVDIGTLAENKIGELAGRYEEEKAREDRLQQSIDAEMSSSRHTAARARQSPDLTEPCAEPQGRAARA